MASTLFVPANSQEHADLLMYAYITATDESALQMLTDGLIGRTREDAEGFIEFLRSEGLPVDQATIFEYPIDV